MARLRGCSLFSGAGIGEAFFKQLGLDIVVSNELIPERANLYSSIYRDTKMICGDIRNKDTFNEILKESQNIDFLIATPPCQGLSIAGKNRDIKDMIKDERNNLIMKVVEFIKIQKPKYVLVENVPSILKLPLQYKGQLINIKDLFLKLFEKEYNLDFNILDSSDYGVPQTRKRAIIRMYKKGLTWELPKKEEKISVRKAIGHLPSLEPGEKSDIPWHYARKHTDKHIEWMKNTPTGQSAFDNRVHRPRKENGDIIKGYNSSYRRIKWDDPSPAITMRNDAISSQRNVHPGRKKKDGTYSDSRVLTPLELMLLSSLPPNWEVPKDTPERLLRQCIGEGVPPLMIKKIIAPLFKNEKQH